jgi:membrane protease YdiL (CAAX protease family)
MVDQLASAESCSACGTPLRNGQFQVDGLCDECARTSSARASVEGSSDIAASAPFGLAQPSQHFQPDPDDPPWGPVTGFSVWLASVAAIIVIPVIAVGIWLAIQAARGVPLPNFAIRSEVEQWALSPNILLLQIVATMVAHAITMAMFWAVVTRLGSRPFWASLGWSWGGHRVWYWVVLSICILLAIQIISQILTRFLPQEESPFDQMLKSSRQVRIAVAFLAVFTAPLVEEVVYRGVLFSSLRKRIGLVATVLVVTVMFAGVHVFQNRGAWVSIAGLAFLSLVLTIVRARTRSLLPCVFIHTLNNAFASVIIVLNKAS